MVMGRITAFKNQWVGHSKVGHIPMALHKPAQLPIHQPCSPQAATVPTPALPVNLDYSVPLRTALPTPVQPRRPANIFLTTTVFHTSINIIRHSLHHRGLYPLTLKTSIQHTTPLHTILTTLITLGCHRLY